MGDYINFLVAEGEELLYENLAFAEPRTEHTRNEDEQVYDVPRQNNSEAIYINQNFEDDLPNYDTPRTRLKEVGEAEEEEEDHIECDYDVPKVCSILPAWGTKSIVFWWTDEHDTIIIQKCSNKFVFFGLIHIMLW